MFVGDALKNTFHIRQDLLVEDFSTVLGWVVFFKSRDIVGNIKNATVSKKGDHWFVSIQTERETEKAVHSARSAIGVDLGIKKFATLSDGRIYEAKNSFKQRQARLAILQQRLAKKKKGSSNFNKLKRESLNST